ncbi:MAG: dihydrolipoamide acetyltransferase family protein [Candidatus Brocadiia bacterium]
MVTKVILPKLAANVDEATVGRWLKSEGEPVSEGEPLFEAITDKASVEVPAEGSGVLRKIVAKENSVVPVGQVIALIAEPDEELPEVEAEAPAAGPAARRPVKASFGARRLAKELGLQIATVRPSRPDGRITEDDVRRAAARAAGPAVLERLPLSPRKRAVAQHLARTAHTVAAAYLTIQADCSALERELPGVSKEAGLAVQPRDVLVYLAGRLLPEHRLLNAAFTEEAILLYEPVNVALALDVEREDSVVVPVIRGAQEKPLVVIAREAASLAERAAAGELEADDVADGTFTVTDQSSLEIDNFVPLLNDKQSAILAMSSIRPRPVARDGAVHVASVANLSVAFDHRVLNGTAAARFLSALKQRVESFGGE